LLDYTKVELREKLIREHQLQIIKKTQEDRSVYNHDSGEGQNLRYLDGNVPKNKDMSKFMASVQQKSF